MELAKLTDSGIGTPPDVTAHADMPEIGVGMLGYGLMGRVHANAYRTLSYMAWRPPLVPRLVSIAGRTAVAVKAAAQRLGYEEWATDWRELVADPRVRLFDNGGPNSLHAAPTIAAARNGKHVLCEKPLGRSAEESFTIWQDVAALGVKHMCAFNYRLLPAVRTARKMIQTGELGEIRHFRGHYLQDWGDDPSLDTWRFRPDEAGSGSLGDLGSHLIDLARFLVGEVSSVASIARTFVPGRHVDDAIEAAVEFEGGPIGTIEVSRLALGHRNGLRWEINGSNASLVFNLDRLNELRIYRPHADKARCFQTVLVSELDMPSWSWWWPPGHLIGWEDTFVCELHHLLTAIAEDTDVAPHGATFEDGYRAAEVCDAILRSAESGQREDSFIPGPKQSRSLNQSNSPTHAQTLKLSLTRSQLCRFSISSR
jgi:predicted dehydrogenase